MHEKEHLTFRARKKGTHEKWEKKRGRKADQERWSQRKSQEKKGHENREPGGKRLGKSQEKKGHGKREPGGEKGTRKENVSQRRKESQRSMTSGRSREIQKYGMF